MSLSNPYAVDAPASLYVASGALGARSLLDATRIYGCSVIWPISDDPNVATSKGRVETQLRRGSAPWIDLAAVRGDVNFTRFEPVYVGEVLQAQSRFVNNAGIASDWTLSPPHQVVDSEVGQTLTASDSRRSGWPGVVSGASQVTPPPGLISFLQTPVDGFAGDFTGAVQMSGDLAQRQWLYRSLFDGWPGTISGALATLIGSGTVPPGTASLDFSKASNSMYLPLIF